jgi:hypothetical protein
VCDVYNTVPYHSVLAKIYITLKAQIRSIKDLFIEDFVGQDKAEIILGKEKAFYITIRAAQQMVGFVQLNRRPTLRTILLYRKAHFSLIYTLLIVQMISSQFFPTLVTEN